MNNIYDLIIIGGGPAGLSCAIYAARANLNVLIIEESQDGGKLSKISQIDNYPGIKSISGFELANQLVEHVKQYNVPIINSKVVRIDNKNVITSNNEIYSGKAILIATGSKQRKLDLENADKFEGNGISYCATCDGFFFRNKQVVVIGNNNQALQESLYLSSLVSKLIIVNRNEILNADDNLIDSVTNNEKITIINNAIATNLIINEEKITGLTIKDIKTNQNTNIECVGIFPYISFNPSTDFVDSSILDDKGYIITDVNMVTKIDGIFAAGDCIQKQLRQIVTACADGAIAASSIIKYIKSKA